MNSFVVHKHQLY